MLPIYMITIDEDDEELGVDYNALVDHPAHMRSFESYGKSSLVKKPQYFVEDNKEEQRVTGVMISAGTPIIRMDEQLGPHFVIFSPDAIYKIHKKFHRNFYNNNINEMHDLDKVIKPGAKGVYMVEDWLVRQKGAGIPVGLSKQGIKEGSWIATYQIEDPQIWAKVKNGTFSGFSVEGYFVKYLVETKKASSFKELSALERHSLYNQFKAVMGPELLKILGK